MKKTTKPEVITSHYQDTARVILKYPYWNKKETMVICTDRKGKSITLEKLKPSIQDQTKKCEEKWNGEVLK